MEEKDQAICRRIQKKERHQMFDAPAIFRAIVRGTANPRLQKREIISNGLRIHTWTMIREHEYPVKEDRRQRVPWKNARCWFGVSAVESCRGP